MRLVRLPGLTDYTAAHALQERLVAARLRGDVDDTVLVLEHPPTITLGRKQGATANVLVPAGVPVVQVERGGDVTWHAPGQLVAYPIIALEGERRDLRRALQAIEGAVIGVLSGLGLPATRDPRNTGVWLPADDGARKVCSVGIAVRQWVTWHGLALNLDIDLVGFQRIRPCGFGAEVMTRLADHLDECPTIDALAEPLGRALAGELGLAWSGVVPAEALGVVNDER